MLCWREWTCWACDGKHALCFSSTVVEDGDLKLCPNCGYERDAACVVGWNGGGGLVTDQGKGIMAMRANREFETMYNWEAVNWQMLQVDGRESCLGD